jgi:integrase
MKVTRGGVSKREWAYEGKRRSTWQYSFKLDGQQIRRQGFLSRAEAQEALEKAREQALRPEAPRPVPVAMTFGQAVVRYLAAKVRKRSLEDDRRIARHLEAVFGKDTLLGDVTAAKVSEYRAQRLGTRRGGQPLSAAAINRPLALLRHLLALAQDEWGVLATVPKIRLEREPQGRLRWLTPDEARALLEACRAQKAARLADLVELALYTGLRQGELLGLTWAAVDRASGVLRVEVTKSGKRRVVPLNGPADAVLARLGGGEGLVFGTRSWDAFRDHWEAAVEAAGLEDLRFHDTRHTFASWAMQRGATLPELKDLLGHSSLAMVMRYAHLSPEHLRSAVARLDTVLASATEAHGFSDISVVEEVPPSESAG